jgi:hypothetical protein
METTIERGRCIVLDGMHHLACYYYFHRCHTSNTQHKTVRGLYYDGNKRKLHLLHQLHQQMPNRYITRPPFKLSCTADYAFSMTNNLQFTFSCSSPYSNHLQILEMTSMLISSTSAHFHTPLAVPAMTPGLEAFHHCHGVA